MQIKDTPHYNCILLIYMLSMNTSYTVLHVNNYFSLK